MKKVLIVEDQRMPRENMERILLDSGKMCIRDRRGAFYGTSS